MTDIQQADLELLRSFVHVSERVEPDSEVEQLLQRKFRVSAPAFPIHFLCHVDIADGSRQLACYLHATDCGDLALGGGACTDSRVLRRLSEPQRDVLRSVGGIYRYTLLHMCDALRDRVAAIFACCGDTLSERVMRRTGWEPTQHNDLFVHWLQGVTDTQRGHMLAKARSFMPF